MDDKFIMMGIDDERSKKVAEILGNKTCKKIIEYLADTKEASEKDISDAFGIPINTAEYNLKKLIDSGLVEKTKNFFWSSRGKKIPMYKISRKHIVISPRSTKPNITALKTILPIIAVVFLLMLFLLIKVKDTPTEQNININKFNSLSEINDYVKKNTLKSDNFGLFENFAAKSTDSAITGASAESGSGATDYSTTNIQVEGVDEADIIKNDGKYIYLVSGNKVIIVDAYPADSMKIISEINLTSNENLGEIYINDNKLILFSREYRQTGNSGNEKVVSNKDIAISKIACLGCIHNGEEISSVYVYDISDKENPKVENKISVSGNYINSRMIDDYVYLVTNKYIQRDNIVLPTIVKNEQTVTSSPEDVYYVNNVEDVSFNYVTISALNIKNSETSQKTIVAGYTNNIYVSKNNIYLTQTAYPSWYYESTEKEKTLVYKISIDKSDINFEASGEVPGHILNQFSMDENEDYFRIATTTGEIWNSKEPSKNNLYVLDKNLNITGKLEGLASGEKIYSVRFMGERAYIVTFKKTDPLFVIDLSNPQSPVVLGELKIPGYSDYLHSYDENHIIGIGKDATETENGFAMYQGIKIAIFDVSDVSNPIELHKISIGDRGTDSEALYNHKAFLFDREKELLVIPITLVEKEDNKNPDGFAYGRTTFRGAYVYNINLEEGFKLRARITHQLEKENKVPASEEPIGATRKDYNENIWTKQSDGMWIIEGKDITGEKICKDEGYGLYCYYTGNSMYKYVKYTNEIIDSFPGGAKYSWYPDYNRQIRRAIYLDDILYTISNKIIKANDLESDNVEEINFIELPYSEQIYYRGYAEASSGVVEGNPGVAEQPTLA